MSTQEQFGSVGVDRATERLIREYFPEYPDSTIEQLLADPQTALTAALLREMRGDTSDVDTDSSTRETGRYFAQEFEVTVDGPRIDGEEPEFVEGKEIDVGAVYDEWDIRGFSDDIRIAWKEPNRTNRAIKYRGGTDNPVAGVPVSTRYVWLWRAESASSDSTVYLEGWS